MENITESSQWTIEHILRPDQVKIRYGYCFQEESSVQRYVLFLNGHGEFIEKYDYLPQDLGLAKEWGFLTLDHRGQGASDGEPRLHIDDYEQFAQDAQAVVAKIIADKPYIIVAHSMGGLIALYATMKGYLKPEKLLMSAPLFGVHNIPTPIGRLIGNIGTQLGFAKSYFQKTIQKHKFKNNLFTYSPERFERRYQWVYKKEGETYGWIKATCKAIACVNEDAKLAKFLTPTKILYGDDERLVSKSAIRKWVKDAKKKSPAQISCEELTKTRHEIFAEAPSSYAQVIRLTREYLLSP